MYYVTYFETTQRANLEYTLCSLRKAPVSIASGNHRLDRKPQERTTRKQLLLPRWCTISNERRGHISQGTR